MPQIRIEHRLGVAAPAEVIWEAISDLAQWPDWSRIYTQAEGQLSIGAPVAFETQFPDWKLERSEGAIVDWVPDTQILWQGKAGFMARYLRFVEIDKLSDVGCIVANGEILEGFGTRYLPPRRRRAALRGYEAMNEAIKARAEGLWQERPAAPKSKS